jgi:hypothetical protein
MQAVYSVLKEAEHRSMTPAPYWDIPLANQVINQFTHTHTHYSDVAVHSIDSECSSATALQRLCEDSSSIALLYAHRLILMLIALHTAHGASVQAILASVVGIVKHACLCR